jgi:predicted phage terminase large subunit-like protein
MGTVRYPVYRLQHDPTLKVIVGAYNQRLANTFSRKARRVAIQVGIPLSPERKAVEDWETAAGGGFRAVGVGAGVTGTGGDLILVDDPVRSRDDAESAVYRDRVWDWYRDDLYTRLEPGGSVILTMTRWHADDLAGRILQSEDGPNWTVLRLPALAEEEDLLGRAPGEALCPERFDRSALEGIRTVLGARSFAALYQGDPQPAEGGVIRTDKIEVVEAVPRVARRVRYWDLAASQNQGDRSASLLMARAEDGLFYVEDVTSGQWSAGERNSRLLETIQRDKERYAGEVATWIPQDPGAAGKEVAEALVRGLAGYRIQAERVTGSKEVRAQPFAAQCEAGNVKLLKGRWNAELLEEFRAFPFGRFDDAVDAASGAFAKLATSGKLFLWGA